MDSKRKGFIFPCVKCKRKTRHMVSDRDKKDKLTYVVCTICGHERLLNNW